MKSKLIPTWLPKGKKAFSVDTPEHMPRLHGLFILAGHRGAGKGVAITSCMRMYKRHGCCDRIFWLSPTIGSNRPYLDELGVKEEDCYDDPDNASIDAVMAEVDEEAKEYADYLEAKKVYTKLHKELARGIAIEDISNDLLLKAEQLGVLDSDQPPKPKYRNGETPPVLHMVLDDCQASKVMSSVGTKSKLTHMCLQHRHRGVYAPGKALGISVWICVQSWCAQGSVPRAIRENCTTCLIWRCPQRKMVEKMADELATGREPEGTFEQAYEEATLPDHGFLLVDMTTTDPTRRYKAGWNRYITPE